MCNQTEMVNGKQWLVVSIQLRFVNKNITPNVHVNHFLLIHDITAARDNFDRSFVLVFGCNVPTDFIHFCVGGGVVLHPRGPRIDFLAGRYCCKKSGPARGCGLLSNSRRSRYQSLSSPLWNRHHGAIPHFTAWPAIPLKMPPFY